MDESHRLINYPMPVGYDVNLFEEIYKKTKDLKNKLVWQINPHKFGVDAKELSSWFDVKILQAFNRYYDDERVEEDRPEKLKAFVIKALQIYKSKIIKDSYHEKHGLNQTMDIEEVFDYETLMIEAMEPEPMDNRIALVKTYYRERLSADAYFLFELELNPPPYIINKLKDPDSKKMPKITNGDWADYLGISYNEDFEIEAFDGFYSRLKKEISEIEAQCRDYFRMIENY